MKNSAHFGFVVTLFASIAMSAGIARAQDDEARKHLLHELGGPFFVSREVVQEDLKLTDDQKKKLHDKMSEDLQEAKRITSLKGMERDKAMKTLRETSFKKLEEFLKDILDPEQLNRFHQMERQYEVPTIMLHPEVVHELKITDEQRKQFITLIQQMHKEMQPLMKEARATGNPREILPKVIKLRQECQSKIEALLNETQQKQWMELIGKPITIW